jgi:hypothetical protein
VALAWPSLWENKTLGPRLYDFPSSAAPHFERVGR